MRQRRLKIHFGPDLFLNRPCKTVKAAKAIYLVCLSNLGLLQRPTQDRQ